MRRSICDFRLKQKDIQQMHSAEVAIAKAQAAADEKREAEKEVAELKKYKDFRERNEEERDLIIQAAKACMFDTKTNELLPAAKQDRANFARCMTVAAQLTAQIKPLSDSNQPDKDDKPGIDRAIEIMKARNDARTKPGS